MFKTRLLHLEELSLGRGKFVWVQTADLGKDWRSRDCREVVENAMLWKGGQKTIRGQEVWVLRENLPNLSKSSLEMSTERIHGGGRGDSRENIQRNCIQHMSSSHTNQDSSARK